MSMRMALNCLLYSHHQKPILQDNDICHKSDNVWNKPFCWYYFSGHCTSSTLVLPFPIKLSISLLLIQCGCQLFGKDLFCSKTNIFLRWKFIAFSAQSSFQDILYLPGLSSQQFLELAPGELEVDNVRLFWSGVQLYDEIILRYTATSLWASFTLFKNENPIETEIFQNHSSCLT